MNSEKALKPNFKNLILDELENAKMTHNAELGAILTGALYQNDCIQKIINTKMTSVCPSVASEAFTTCNELAEKIYEKRKQNAAETSGAV